MAGKRPPAQSNDNKARSYPAAPRRLAAALPPDAPAPSGVLTAMICLGLALAAIAVYAQVYRYGYVEYDDSCYMRDNAFVKHGPTPDSIRWAFTNFTYANWHPLTWLSLMLDCRLFGVKPQASHVVNLFFHVGAAVLLFLAFLKMTNRPWRSALVAGIFALHPMHVESVAWISERKDVLHAFFAGFALLAYAYYARKPGVLRYLCVALAFACGLMAKSMLVTLPFVLMLLDLWPLGRLTWPPAWKGLKFLLLEKAPLFAMSAAMSVATYLAQKQGGAVSDFARMPFSHRVGNVSIAYASYVGKAFWPVNLGVMYPIQPYPAPTVAAAIVFLLAVTAVLIVLARKRPYALVGWLWFLGMLVPVIGLVQVGAQLMADRYTYLPLVGLSFAVVWPAADLFDRGRLARGAGAAAACVALALLGALTYRQVGYWRTSEALFQHTLSVTCPNPVIHTTLGVVYDHEGLTDKAIEEYRKAIAIHPSYADAHNGLGLIYFHQKKYDEAVVEYNAAISYQDDFAAAHNNLGAILDIQGKHEEALAHYKKAVTVQGDMADAHANMAIIYSGKGDQDAAIKECRLAIAANPDYPDAHDMLGFLLVGKHQSQEAIAEYNKALALKPDYADAHANLGHELLAMGKAQDAYPHLVKAVELQPTLYRAQGDMGIILAWQGKFAEAVQHLQESLRIKGDQAEAHSNLAFALTYLNRFDEAVSHCNEALKLDPKSVDAHYNLANALAAQGKTAEASAEFSKVLSLNPSNAAARAALDKLKGSR